MPFVWENVHIIELGGRIYPLHPHGDCRQSKWHKWISQHRKITSLTRQFSLQLFARLCFSINYCGRLLVLVFFFVKIYDAQKSFNKITRKIEMLLSRPCMLVAGCLSLLLSDLRQQAQRRPSQYTAPDTCVQEHAWGGIVLCSCLSFLPRMQPVDSFWYIVCLWIIWESLYQSGKVSLIVWEFRSFKI